MKDSIAKFAQASIGSLDTVLGGGGKCKSTKKSKKSKKSKCTKKSKKSKSSKSRCGC